MSEVFSPAWSGRLALITAAVMALAVIWLLVRLVWLVVDGPQVDSAPVPPVPEVAPSSSGSGDFAFELFGNSTAPAARVRAAPKSRLSLRLRGVVAGENGYAIISESGGSDEVYRVGDDLPGGARIESIESRRVLIDHNGRTEALEIDEDRSRSGGGDSPQVAADAAVSLPGIRGMQSASDISVASLPESVRASALDGAGLANAISVMPVSSGGFRVRPGRNATLFSQLGLQVNDVVKAVNGQPLESEADVEELFADVMMRGEVSITVERGGREMTLRPDLEEIIGSLE